MKPVWLLPLLAAALGGVCVVPASAQDQVAGEPVPPAATAAEEKKAETVSVTLTTSEGPIVLELEKEKAPITTASFLKYVDSKRFDGQTFYRALNIAENFGLIQAGVTKLKPGDTLPPPIAHEPTTQTGLSHQTGTVSMARGAPGSARWDFFIVLGDMSSLDAHPDKPGDNLGFAAFGHVEQGMDVVMKIMGAPISPTLGEKEGMKGQMLEAPVTILSARRTKVAQ